MSQIADIVRKIIGERDNFAFMAKVSEVDVHNLTCTLSPLDGKADFVEVPLQGVAVLSGWVLVPKVGSNVLAVMTSPKSASIVTTPDIETAKLYATSFELGGSEGEPVVLGDSLNETLDALFGQLDVFLGDIQSFATTQSAASVGPLAPLAAGFTTLNVQASLVKTRLDQIRAVLEDHLSEKVTSV